MKRSGSAGEKVISSHKLHFSRSYLKLAERPVIIREGNLAERLGDLFRVLES